MSAVILMCMLTITNAPPPAWLFAVGGFFIDCYFLRLILRG